MNFIWFSILVKTQLETAELSFPCGSFDTCNISSHNTMIIQKELAYLYHCILWSLGTTSNWPAITASSHCTLPDGCDAALFAADGNFTAYICTGNSFELSVSKESHKEK